MQIYNCPISYCMIIVKKRTNNFVDSNGNYWLNVWGKFSLSKATCCAIMGCDRTNLVGAHVQNINIESDTFFILPLCKKHANFSSPMLANPITPMIPTKVVHPLPQEDDSLVF